jgi:hypothetical protein
MIRNKGWNGTRTNTVRSVNHHGVMALIVLLLAGCTYWDGGMLPDDRVRATRMKAAYSATIVGQTTRKDAEAALGLPYCSRSLRSGEVELRWGGLSTKINDVQFLGVRTKRYVVNGQWDLTLAFRDDVLVDKAPGWNSPDSDQPCVVTCPECRFRSVGTEGNVSVPLDAGPKPRAGWKHE